MNESKVDRSTRPTQPIIKKESIKKVVEMDSSLSKKVDIHISCRSLRDVDLFSKSDPFVIIKMKNNLTGQWATIGQTNVVKNNLNPDFKEGLTVDYLFEELQECYFQVMDFDSEGHHDLIGECFTTLSAIVGSRNSTLVAELTHKS